MPPICALRDRFYHRKASNLLHLVKKYVSALSTAGTPVTGCSLCARCEAVFPPRQLKQLWTVCEWMYHLAENYMRNSFIKSKTIVPQSITHRIFFTGLLNSKNIWSSEDYSYYIFSLYHLHLSSRVCLSSSSSFSTCLSLFIFILFIFISVSFHVALSLSLVFRVP